MCTMTIRPSHAKDLEFRRIEAVIRQNGSAPITIAISIIFSLAAGWNKVPAIYLYPWTAAFIALALVRIIIYLRWKHLVALDHIFEMSELRRWSWVVNSGAICSGFFIGLIAVGARFYLSPEQELYLGLMVLGVAASSIAAYSLSLPCAVGVVTSSIGIWITGLALSGDRNELMVLLIIFLAVNILLARNWNKYAMKALRTTAELYQNQERLRLALDSSGAACWSWDPSTGSFSADANMSKVLGGARFKFETLVDFLECVHPQDLNTVRLAFANATSKGGFDIEHRLEGDYESPRFVAVRGRMQGEKASSRIVSGIAWDITDKRNEERIRFERDLLDRANRTKLMFLANVSHEMRTPLTAINGFTENVLTEGDFPPRLKEKLNIVLRNGRYLTSVVHDLLDLAKAEADNIFIQKGKVNLPEEINDSIHVVRAGLERKNLKLEVVYDSPVPEVIVTDATRLRQILINLLSNSIKYTDTGGIVIRVSYEPREVSGYLRIVVADTGIGISEQDRSNLFQPFTRGESLQVRNQHGSGLGLVLSRSLAIRLGGDLRLLSTTPQTESQTGSTAFEVVLDAGPCENVRRLKFHPVITTSSGRPQSSLEDSFAHRRILLVEDDEDIRWLLQEYLEKRGAFVVTCANGAEGVQAAFESNFDAVLMDIKMPVLDGYQATQILRRKGFRQPIIALTAHANSSDMSLCYEAGCDYYLSKPVDFNHLDEVLRRSIDTFRSENSSLA